MIETAPRLIVIAVAFLAVTALGTISAISPADRAGWRNIKPSAMHWVGLWLSGALTLFMTYIYLFVGSSRADAAQQMAILFWLILAFGLGTVIVALSIQRVRRTGLRWRGDRLVFQGQGGEMSFRLSDIAGAKATLLGSHIVSFRDGTLLHVDPHAQGAAELIDAIADLLGANQARGEE
jgi:hypothetical protein